MCDVEGIGHETLSGQYAVFQGHSPTSVLRKKDMTITYSITINGLTRTQLNAIDTLLVKTDSVPAPTPDPVPAPSPQPIPISNAWEISGQRFMKNGKRRFLTMANVRGFAFPGVQGNPISQNVTVLDRNKTLNWIHENLFSGIRFAAAHSQLTTEQCIERGKIALDKLYRMGMFGIIYLSESASGFSPQSDYLDFVKAYVGELGSHPAARWFQIGVGTLCEGQSECLKFYTTATMAIRERAPDAWISSGGANMVTLFGDDREGYVPAFYGLFDLIDVGTNYDVGKFKGVYGDNTQAVEEALASGRDLAMPVVLHALGVRREDTEDGSDIIRDHLTKFQAAGGAGAAPWGISISNEEGIKKSWADPYGISHPGSSDLIKMVEIWEQASIW